MNLPLALTLLLGVPLVGLLTTYVCMRLVLWMVDQQVDLMGTFHRDFTDQAVKVVGEVVRDQAEATRTVLMAAAGYYTTGPIDGDDEDGDGGGGQGGTGPIENTGAAPWDRWGPDATGTATAQAVIDPFTTDPTDDLIRQAASMRGEDRAIGVPPGYDPLSDILGAGPPPSAGMAGEDYDEAFPEGFGE